MNKLATQTNTRSEHRLYLAPKQEDVHMGSAIAKTLTANICKAGLARLQRVDIEQRRAPQAALAIFFYLSQKCATDCTLVREIMPCIGLRSTGMDEGSAEHRRDQLL